MLVSSPALAHDVSIDLDFGDMTPQSVTHEDFDPWKGNLSVTATNSGLEAWGDFHFEIFEVTGDITNVDWVVDSPHEPTSSQSPLSWVVDNNAYGATLDLYFYGDPILPTETATFTVYTDNTTDNVSFFGVAMYPTPIPEPATILTWLSLGSIMGFVAYRRRRK